MKTSQEILQLAGDVFVEKLRQQFEDKGLNDTHTAEKSLSSSVSDKMLKIEGLLRTVVLITGREPGKFPPIEPIRKWVASKLGITEEKENKRVAFLVARKIATEGTAIFSNRAKGLQIELILIELNKQLQKEVSEQLTLDITKTIMDEYEK